MDLPSVKLHQSYVICVTSIYTADYRSWRQITLLGKVQSTRHNAVKHEGPLVTYRFYGVMS